MSNFAPGTDKALVRLSSGTNIEHKKIICLSQPTLPHGFQNSIYYASFLVTSVHVPPTDIVFFGDFIGLGFQ